MGTKSFGKVNCFIQTVPETGPAESVKTQLTKDDKVKALSLIVGQLGKNLDLIEKNMLEDPRLKVSKEEDVQKQIEAFNKLKSIIEIMDKPTISPSSSSEKLQISIDSVEFLCIIEAI